MINFKEVNNSIHNTGKTMINFSKKKCSVTLKVILILFFSNWYHHRIFKLENLFSNSLMIPVAEKKITFSVPEYLFLILFILNDCICI